MFGLGLDVKSGFQISGSDQDPTWFSSVGVEACFMWVSGAART